VLAYIPNNGMYAPPALLHSALEVTNVENADLGLATPEDIDLELHEIAGPDRGGVPPGSYHRAARLFLTMNDFFKTVYPRKGRILGFQRFDDWARARQKTLSVARTHIYNFVNIGQHLLSRVSEDELKELALVKATALARLAKKGMLTPEILKESFGMKLADLWEKVAFLLGEDFPLTKNIVINSHNAAEAVLLLLGNWENHETYTADRAKVFRGKRLGEIATLEKLPQTVPGDVLKSLQKIDVIWFKGIWPKYFFEIEHTTDMTKGLHRMYQAVNFDAKLFVVAPACSHTRFLREIEKEPFKSSKEKYRFRSYPELLRLFKAVSNYRKTRDPFFS
jgi:hypothetical protein